MTDLAAARARCEAEPWAMWSPAEVLALVSRAEQMEAWWEEAARHGLRHKHEAELRGERIERLCRVVARLRAENAELHHVPPADLSAALAAALADGHFGWWGSGSSNLGIPATTPYPAPTATSLAPTLAAHPAVTAALDALVAARTAELTAEVEQWKLAAHYGHAALSKASADLDHARAKDAEARYEAMLEQRNLQFEAAQAARADAELAEAQRDALAAEIDNHRHEHAPLSDDPRCASENAPWGTCMLLSDAAGHRTSRVVLAELAGVGRPEPAAPAVCYCSDAHGMACSGGGGGRPCPSAPATPEEMP